MVSVSAVAVLFLALFLLALYGYGCRLVRAEDGAAGPGIACAVGLGIILALCGPIELLRCASRPLLLSLVGIGDLLGLLALRGRRAALPAISRRTVASLDAAALVLVMIGALYAAFLVVSSAQHAFNEDDWQSYLVLPQRILEQGSTGRDPFFYRRIEDGVGGIGYLFAIAHAVLALPSIRIVDDGIGSIILALLVGFHLREFSASRWQAVWAFAAAFAVVLFIPEINSSPNAIPIALGYALLRLAAQRLRTDKSSARGVVAIAVVAFALIALKSNYGVMAFCACASLYISLFLVSHRARIAVAYEGLAALAVVVVLMLPGMLVSYETARTALYPLLGSGTLVSLPGNTATLSDFLYEGKHFVAFMSVAALLVIARLRTSAGRADKLFAILLFASAFCAFTYVLLHYPFFGYRYIYSGIASIGLYALVEQLSLFAAGGWRLRWAALGTSALALLAMSNTGISSAGRAAIDWLSPGVATDAADMPLDSAKLHQLKVSLGALQNAIPPGKTVVVLLDAPFALDFRRNVVWIMDWPGMMGPPGLPASASATEWVRYWKRLGVDYVACSYGREPMAALRQFSGVLAEVGHPSAYMELELRRAIEIGEMMKGLKDRLPVVFDDGTRFVAKIDTKEGD
jgi:hypothetical protein